MNKRVLFIAVAGLLVASRVWFPISEVEAREELDVVVNKANKVDNLSLDDILKIFKGDKTTWPDGKHIKVLMLVRGEPGRSAVLHEIYKMAEADYSKYFLQATFTGRIQAPPKEFESPSQLKYFLVANPGAIACLSKNDVDESVKVILRLP